jgi:DNA-directed RNA polymerase subunit RPC12/RpoP
MVGDAYIVSPGGEHERYMKDRLRVNNLVMFENGVVGADDLYCKICNQKRVIMSKAQLLNIGLSQQFNEKVESRCDDNTGYSFCQKCCGIVFEPKSSQSNHQVGAMMCVKCMDGGKRNTYTPKLIQNKWYWHCPSCGHKEEMGQSSLKKTVVDPKSFIHSIGTKKKQLDPDLMTGATLIADRDYPAPQQ